MRCVQIVVYDPSTPVAAGTGLTYFVVPTELNNFVLSRVAATMVGTGGTSGSTAINLVNVGTANTGSSGMLSDYMLIDATKISTRQSTSGHPGTIQGTASTVTTGQMIRIDVPTNMTSAGTGLIVELAFQ